jgi:hypothetical protein
MKKLRIERLLVIKKTLTIIKVAKLVLRYLL